MAKAEQLRIKYLKGTKLWSLLTLGSREQMKQLVFIFKIDFVLNYIICQKLQ